MTNFVQPVIGGVDTHKRTHQAAAISINGQLLGDREFPATVTGHAALGKWLASFGPVEAVGVEGTGSYGAALTAVLQSAGQRVIEVNRPSHAARRLTGKSDVIDAEQAARSVRAAITTAAPKSKAAA
ncbi:MAG: transposase [Planctomycetaceae bacterium]|nr:transposase [Planctomycetaceae bacterium]